MSLPVEALIVATKTVILLLGSGITYLAVKASRKTRDESLRLLAVGFGIVTLGVLLGGIAQQLFGVTIAEGVLINSTLVLLGFGVIIYSLYRA